MNDCLSGIGYRIARCALVYVVIFILCLIHRNEMIDFLSLPMLETMYFPAEIIMARSGEMFFVIIGLTAWMAAFLSFPYFAIEGYALIWAQVVKCEGRSA